MGIVRSGASLGQYGRSVGGTIEFEWVPDPINIADKVLAVRDGLEDRTVPLILSSAIISRDIEENFEGEHDPEGQPWQPWTTGFTTDAGGKRVRDFYYDPVTDKSTNTPLGYAERVPQMNPPHSGMILNWQGRLKNAATSPEAFVQLSGETINDDSLYFDTGGLPEWWEWHQEGLPNRTTKSGSPNPLAQRRFLGLSDNAEIDVLEVFDLWFQGVIDMATSTRGRIFARMRPGKPRARPQTLA